MARLASDPEFAGVTAKYYSIDAEIPSSPASYDEAKQAEVWEYSEALVEKLATFALRRAMTIDDRTAIRKIAAAAKADGYRLRSLVEAVATSDLIRRR